ncbi:helix-turn-helix transcriptional regulator [Halomonas sp. BC1]|uniref:helix-turn-helix transcriptional regulator n=1 Tax=Halomonas sp. BC1 TaxID=1670448 RepID=UPI0009BEA48B|nr:AlpA family phage regulatory protein [Halomonas sp. BC1]
MMMKEAFLGEVVAMAIQTRLMSEKEVEEVTGIDRYQRRYMVREGLFPSPVRVSYRKIAYFEDEINAWLEERRNDRSIKAKNYWQPAERLEPTLENGVVV